MAKLYHKRPIQADDAMEAGELLSVIETFLSNCRQPAVLEAGEEMMPLRAGEYAIEVRSGRVSIEVWNDTRNVSRRIVSIDRHTNGVLDCTVHRFGGKPGSFSFLDLDRPQTAHKAVTGARQNFAEQFRRMLFRQFPGWEISTLSAGMDLQHSLSPIFPRACLERGHRRIAAIACPTVQDETAMLTFALIWLDHLRARRTRSIEISACVFLPENAGALTAHRLHWLKGQSLTFRIFRFNAHGSAGEVDPDDLGNLETSVKTTAASRDVQHINRPGGKWQDLGASERALERAVRANITAIDPALVPNPIHGQVLAFAATDRDLIDLLAVTRQGRLAILELKVSEDLHLPLQALDYWMRIRWHAERGELAHLFPGVPILPEPPKLFLIAPAMAFHSSNNSILRYFSPEIEVERVGVNSDWEHHLKVVLRLSGANTPISHGSCG